jgi:hypothetical protein
VRPAHRSAWSAAEAGILLRSSPGATAIDIVEAAINAGRIDPVRIDASWRRIAALKARLGSA